MSRSPVISGEVAGSESLTNSIHRFAAATMRLTSIDPLTTELVRLRAATYHDCRS